MGATVYIFAHQAAAIGVPTIDDPAAAAKRLSRMIHHLHTPCPETIIQTSLGGASTAFLVAHEDAEILDTHSINNSMRVDAISRISGAERYYLLDVHSHTPGTPLVVLPYVYRNHVLSPDNTGDILPAFIENHGSPEDRLLYLRGPSTHDHLICRSDVAIYLKMIETSLDDENIPPQRIRLLTEIKEKLILSGD